MFNINKLVLCFCIFNLYCNCTSAIDDIDDINEDVEQEDLDEIDDDAETDDSETTDTTTKESDSEKKDDSSKPENKNSNAVGGFYSGFDVKYVKPKLTASETKSDNKVEDYDTKSNLISPSMTLGYDFLLDKLILGGECNVAFNFGSSLDYKDKVYNQEIAKIDKGINFIGALKIGVALGSVVVYGKIGGDLSKWNYNWKLDNKNDNEKKYKAGLLYGGGIEKQFRNNFYLRTEFSYSPNIKHDGTKQKVKDCKMSDIKTNNYQISIGGGYRF